MTDKILKYIFMSVGILLLGICVYLYFSNRSLQNDLTQQILDNNKIGYELKLSENALMSVGYINKLRMDSIINAGDKQVKHIIDSLNEHPLIVTKWKTNTIIQNIEVPTYVDADSTYRIAEITAPNNWYHFKSRYQIFSPFKFTLLDLSLPDYYQVVTVKRPDNRVAVYISNKNPYVHLDSSETLVDPVMVTQYKTDTLIQNKWKWGINLLTNVKTKNNSWFNTIDLNAAIYSPIGVGAIIGTSYYRDLDKVDLKLGIGYLKNF